MLDKLLCIYHSFTTEVSLLQIINSKKLTKTDCSSRVVVQYVHRKTLQKSLKNGVFLYFFLKKIKLNNLNYKTLL